MTSAITRFAMASGIAPSRPRPTSTRSFRSFLATTRMTPSSMRARPIFQRLYLGSGKRAGEIGDARFERRHRDLGSERKARQQDAGGDEAEPAFEHQRDYCFAGAPGLPKSTVGGFEIAFSSSTLKLGLTW